MDELSKLKIQAVINTLNSIQIAGRDNLDKMLGCLMTLEKLLTEESQNGE